jgi:outer membrane autotransporter protein
MTYPRNNGGTDHVDSYQATIYGDHKLGEHSYVNAMAADVWNNNDTARFNVGGVPNLTARGKFSSNQLALRAEVGWHINFGRYTLTPNARLNYMHYAADNYTETGAGGANLSIKTQGLDSLEAGLGAKVSTMFKVKKSESAIVPSVQGGYRYGMISDPVEMTSSFTGGGAPFHTQGIDPARHIFNIGTTVKYIINPDLDLIASYKFDYKAGFTAHSEFLRVAYKF